MPRTNYKSTSKPKLVEKVWSKAKPIRGKDPDKVRKDAANHLINKASYGKTTAMGWQIDHIKAKNKGGSNDIVNLQPLQSSYNMSKGDSLKKAGVKK
jgi:5-methylcytosine-specific restriction endonuclease McrA